MNRESFCFLDFFVPIIPIRLYYFREKLAKKPFVR